MEVLGYADRQAEAKASATSFNFVTFGSSGLLGWVAETWCPAAGHVLKLLNGGCDLGL